MLILLCGPLKRPMDLWGPVPSLRSLWGTIGNRQLYILLMYCKACISFNFSIFFIYMTYSTKKLHAFTAKKVTRLEDYFVHILHFSRLALGLLRSFSCCVVWCGVVSCGVVLLAEGAVTRRQLPDCLPTGIGKREG